MAIRTATIGDFNKVVDKVNWRSLTPCRYTYPKYPFSSKDTAHEIHTLNLGTSQANLGSDIFLV